MNRLFIPLLFCFTSIALSSQTLVEKLENKINYKEISAIAETHFTQMKANGEERSNGDIKEKHFRRWQWYMRNRLDENGNIFNHGEKTQKAYEILKRQLPTSNARNSVSDWTFTGPSVIPNNPTVSDFPGNGRIDRIAFHQTNANIIFAGTPSGGLWKTTNGGNSWFPLDRFLPTQGIAGIATHPSDPNLVFVVNGSGDGNGNYLNTATGIYISRDGGFDWEFKPFGFNARAYSIAINPLNINKIYISTTKGIRQSLDGGETWKTIRDSTHFTDVYIEPIPPYRVHACGTTEVVWSSNDFISYNTATFSGGDPKIGRKSFATSIDDPSIIYLHTTSAADTVDGKFSGFFKSTNNGDSYSLITNAPNIAARPPGTGISGQTAYNHCAAASPNDVDMVVVGGLVIWKNENGGSFSAWNSATPYGIGSLPIDRYVHPDVHALEYNPINGWLYAGTDGGIYRSTDDGDNWLNITNGITTGQFFSIAVCPSDPNRIIGGSQDNGAKYKNSSSNIWDLFGGGDSYITAYDPIDIDKFYYVSHGTVYRRDGNNVNIITPSGLSNTTHSQVQTHATLSDVVYVGTRSDTLCMSGNPTNPNSWVYRSLKSDLCIATTPASPTTLYVAGGWYSGPEINRSTNTGLDWTRIDNNGLPDFEDINQHPTDISVSPTNSQRLAVSISGYEIGEKVYQSFDSGNSWTNISANIPNVPIHCITYLSNGGILAGTELGVFYKMSTSTNWIPFSNNLPIIHVSEMIVNEAQGIVTICTYGRGTFQTEMPDAFCDNSIIWSDPEAIQGQHFYSANQLIETKSVINYGGDGTQIYFQSGNRVILKEGFHAKTNRAGKVKAYIAPCGSEIPE